MKVECVRAGSMIYITAGKVYECIGRPSFLNDGRFTDVNIFADDGKSRWYLNGNPLEGDTAFKVVLDTPEPAKTDKTNPKEVLGKTKPMLGLNPRVALIWMAKAFEFGAHGLDALGQKVRPKGYGEYNWRETQIRTMVYVHAIERHIADYLDGEDVASDSKVKHLGHIMACCAIVLDAEECGTLIDDRPKIKGKAASLIDRLTIALTGK